MRARCRALHALTINTLARRFLWFVLKERKFDDTAVEDLIVLKNRMSLSNEEVAAALYERCIRIEKKFGNLMLQTDGAF
jgi:hypothetical protein